MGDVRLEVTGKVRQKGGSHYQAGKLAVSTGWLVYTARLTAYHPLKPCSLLDACLSHYYWRVWGTANSDMLLSCSHHLLHAAFKSKARSRSSRLNLLRKAVHSF